MAEEKNTGLRRLLDTLTTEFGASDAATAAAPARAARVDLRYQPKIDLRRRCLAGAVAFVAESGDAAFFEGVLGALFADWATIEQAGFNLRLALAMPMDALIALPMAELAGEWKARGATWPGLIVEIGEDEIAHDIARAQAIADELKPSGIDIAINNFGAGYSSFASLRELSFAEIKLNTSFVRGCAANATSAAICQTAIELAHRFDALAVAEGIAAAVDLNALQIMGCDLGQGSLLAPALARGAFVELLQNHRNTPAAADAAKSA